MPNQTPSQISDDLCHAYNYSKNKDKQLKNKLATHTNTVSSIKTKGDFKIFRDALQSSAVIYAGEAAAINELKNLAIEEISNGSANPLILADLLEQAIAIAEEINETNLSVVLSESIFEAKVVLEAIYDGTIDDFKILDSDHNTPAFSEEFESLKTAIITSPDQKKITVNTIYTN